MVTPPKNARQALGLGSVVVQFYVGAYTLSVDQALRKIRTEEWEHHSAFKNLWIEISLLS